MFGTSGYDSPSGHGTSVFEVLITSEGDGFRYRETGRQDCILPAPTVFATIISRAATGNAAPWILAFGLAAAGLAIGVPLLAVATVAATAVAAVGVTRHCQRRRSSTLYYSLSEVHQAAYAELQKQFVALGQAKALWWVNPDAPASGRWPLRLGATLKFVNANLAIPGIAVSSDAVYFFPDHVLLRTRNTYSATTCADVTVGIRPFDITETSWVPQDATAVGQTWEHAKKDGGPDLRYRYNPQHPVVRYALVTLKLERHRFGLLISNFEQAAAFASALESTYHSSARAARVPRPATAVTEPPALVTGQWVAAGQTVQVGGAMIPGMVYSGRGLRALNGGGPEPSFLDPHLPVAASAAGFDAQEVPYWPSYSEISPAARNAYLAWHTGGRSAADAPVCFVFLYFYGLERRLLHDHGINGSRTSEYGQILEEVRRLLAVYRDNHSFRGYASSLIEFAEALRMDPAADTPALEPGPAGGEYPARLRIALGAMAQMGKPLPEPLARAWATANPAFSRRTPFLRCGGKFTELFELRYRERFGKGIVVKPNKTRIRLEYRPASASFGDAVSIERNIPDITVPAEPGSQLRVLAEECVDALDSYSRYLGRNPDGEADLAALALLPSCLLARTGPAAAIRAALARRIGHNALIERNELLGLADIAVPSAFGKRDAVLVAQTLAAMGFGIEPDVRFGGPVPSKNTKICLFQLPEAAASAPSAEYSAATVLVHLAAVVSTADGVVSQQEQACLEEHVAGALHLAEDERHRLHAHLRWALSERPGLNGIKKRIQVLALSQRQVVGRFLVGVANIDGRISPEEVETLGKIYRMLGLNPDDVYRDAHEAATEPVTVKPASGGGGFALPGEPAPTTTAGIQLDAAAVEAKLRETAAVSALLASVFAEETVTEPAPRPAGGESCIAGLDAGTSGLVRLLVSKVTWNRSELEIAAAERALLLDGAIEAINESSFDSCDEPALEGEDPVEVNLPVLNSLIQRTLPA